MWLRILYVAGLLLSGACSRPPRNAFHSKEMQLWYWHHAYVVTPEAVAESKARIDRAAKAGYTGVAFWDSSWTFLNTPNWRPANVDKLREVVEYAAAKKLRVLPTVAVYGHSNDALKQNPNWAEGQRVTGARFEVTREGGALRQLRAMPQSFGQGPQPFLRSRFSVTPWRQYHVHLAVRTSGFQGLAQIEIFDGKRTRLDANLHPARDQEWTPLDYTFNSAGSGIVQMGAGVYGPHQGDIQVDQVSWEETALVYVLRRPGTPLRIYDPRDPSHVYEEGRDFDPVHDQKLLRTPEFAHDNYHDPGAVTIPAGSRLKPGNVVAMDYYAVAPVYDESVSVCLSEPAVERWMVDNARASAALLPPGSGLMLSHDEIRQMNSCGLCRAKHLTAGALLAQHMERLTKQLEPFGPLYVWSDMFDPGHNAKDNFYAVEGTLAKSWEGLAPGITIMNWNLEHLRTSLLWFSGDDPRQPVPHTQIIAGFYDPPNHDGAAAARQEWAEARAIPGVTGMMYTTWNDDYTQLESFARGAREGWEQYRRSRPW